MAAVSHRASEREVFGGHIIAYQTALPKPTAPIHPSAASLKPLTEEDNDIHHGYSTMF